MRADMTSPLSDLFMLFLNTTYNIVILWFITFITKHVTLTGSLFIITMIWLPEAALLRSSFTSTSKPTPRVGIAATRLVHRPGLQILFRVLELVHPIVIRDATNVASARVWKLFLQRVAHVFRRSFGHPRLSWRASLGNRMTFAQ